MAAGEPVVSALELASATRKIRELERLLGRKTLESEVWKPSRWPENESGLRARPDCPGTTSEDGVRGPGCGAQQSDRTGKAAGRLVRWPQEPPPSRR